MAESSQKKAFENELQIMLRGILASDDSRRAAFQLACDEEQQVVAVCTLLSNVSHFIGLVS